MRDDPSQSDAQESDGSDGDPVELAFDRARAQTGEDRAATLAQFELEHPSHAPRLRKLLDSFDAMGSFLEEGSAVPDLEVDDHDLTGAVIGPYVVGSILGEGGFGTVYAAEQTAPLRRSVAIKVIKLGMDTRGVLARFEAEREALARMDHPNIARVFDAGKTEAGRPYFVMERVDGLPITECCDRARLGPRERLELFRRVCAAVQHAHQQGVIHRDLKPTNVLVKADGKQTHPKVIDFGIAKATHRPLNDNAPETQPHQLLGTPEYMSPEQTNPEERHLDTRSDVYSLGVILYELLTGTTPLRRSHSESTRLNLYQHIRESDPPRPSTTFSDGQPPKEVADRRGTDSSTLKRMLERDLDWIVMRAIERDRERRYDSVDALASDIRRFLDGDPVEARPPSALYRWSKFVRRHRVAFVTGAAFLGVLMISIAILSVVSIELGVERNRARDAERSANSERKVAIGAREESDEVTAFLTEMLTDLAPYRSGHDVRVRDVLESAAERVEATFSNRPRIRARLHHAIGDSYRSLGLYSEGITHLERAVDLRRQLLGADAPATRESRRVLGGALRRNGSLATAAAVLQEVADDEQHAGASTSERVATSYEIAATQLELGNFERAKGLLRECIDTARDIPELGRFHRLATLSLGSIHYRFGELAEAEACFRRVIELSSSAPESADALNARKRLAQVLQRRGESKVAIEEMRQLIDLHQRIFGPEHPDTYMARSDLALSLIQMGEPEGEAVLTKLLDEAETTLGRESLRFQGFREIEAGRLLRHGEAAEVEAICREVLEVYGRSYPANHPKVVATQHRLGIALQRQARLEEAEAIYRDSLETAESELGALHPTSLKLRMSLAVIYSGTNRLDRAIIESRRAIDGLSQSLGPENSATLGARTNLSVFFRRQGDYPAAEKELLEVLPIKRRVLGDRGPYTLNCMYGLAQVYLSTDRPGAALPLLEEYVESLEATVGAEHGRTKRGRELLEQARSASSRSQ